MEVRGNGLPAQGIVKILIDMNLPPAWESFLVANGHEAQHWSNVGDPRAPDRTLMEWARDRGFVVLTCDLDFSILLALTAASGPSVVQVRSQRTLPGDIGPVVVDAIREMTSQLSAGAIVTIDEFAARVRVLPVRRD